MSKSNKKKTTQIKPVKETEKKKVSVRDWILIGVSAVALLILIYIVYSTKRYDREVSKILTSDSQKENFTVAQTADAIDSVQINEISSEKWIELYNSGNAEADISGTKILVAGKVAATIADETTIAGGSYYVVDLSANPGALDENVISFVGADERILDTLTVPKISGKQSYGLTQNNNFNIGFMEATKQAANKAELTAENYTYYDNIGFSTPGGFYDKSFSLSLSSKNGDKIYYTVDGTEPTTSSQEYTDSFAVGSNSGSNYVYAKQGFGYLGKENYYPYTIDAGMVVRAITVNSSGKVTGTATQEYYIGLSNDSAYANIPVLSLTANPDDLFGYFDGIYVPGRTKEDAMISGEKDTANYANFLNKWTRDGRISFYNDGKDKTFEMDTTISIYSDIQIATRQKSFKFTFSDASAFEGSSLKDYINDNTLILQSNIDDLDVKIRDIIANKLMEGSAVGTLELSPCILFINGEYWGVYLLKAPYNASYVERNFGVKDEVYFHEGNTYQSEFNKLYNFVTRNDMSSNENYSEVKSMMDIDSYIEYVCLNVYLGNSNFRTTTGTQWRTVEAGGTGYKDGKWRWLMNWPIGNSMGNADTQTPSIDTFIQLSLRMDRFFQSLLMNKEFCSKLSITMDKMMSERFTQEKWESIVDDASTLMKKPTIDTYVRFYGSMKDAQYNQGVEVLRKFLMARSEYMAIYTKEIVEKGGDLKFIAEMEAQGIDVDEVDEASEGDSTEEGEATENGENAENTANGGTGENAAPAQNTEAAATAASSDN